MSNTNEPKKLSAEQIIYKNLIEAFKDRPDAGEIPSFEELAESPIAKEHGPWIVKSMEEYAASQFTGNESEVREGDCVTGSNNSSSDIGDAPFNNINSIEHD